MAKQVHPAPMPEVSRGRRYLLYGAGKLGRTVLQALRKVDVEVLGFIDQSAAIRSELENIPVLSLDSQRVRDLYADADGIIITVYNHRVDLKEIYRALNRHGYDKIYAPPALMRSLPRGSLSLDYWLDLAEDAPSSDEIEARIAETHNLLDDAPSRELLLELVELRLTGDYARVGNRLHAPDLERQYFPGDLPGAIDARRMIDCGAFDGDSLRAAYCFAAPVEKAACFEPDPENFKKLAASVRLQPAQAEVELFPLAVWHQNALLSFQSSQNASSSVAGNDSAAGSGRTSYIQAVRLDDALGNFRPTLIKMDIEGAEPEALQGAAQLVAANRPHLAICVYHRLRHYWEIPQLVKSIDPGYRLYLRQHGFNGQETVLYALPK